MKLLLVALALSPVLLTSCATEPTPMVCLTTVAFTAPAKLGGCTVGDLDPASPGNEIAAVSITGEVFLVRRDGDAWSHEVIAKLPGELIQCVAGDVFPEIGGNELLVFGMMEGTEDDGGAGAAYLLLLSDDGWVPELLLADEALIHAGCIAEVDPRYHGPEIVLAGFGLQVFVLHAIENGWESELALRLEAPAKNAVGFDGGAAIGCADGQLLHLRLEEGRWTSTLLDEAPAGQSRLGVAGDRLIAARDDGVLALLEGGERTEIYREGAKLRGAVLAELDPYSPGLEAATAGYEKRLTVLTRRGETWEPWTVFEDTDRFHHVASGELRSDSPGEELVACGYSGKLILVSIEPAPIAK